ncbi:MAG: ATP-binding protein [Candidatus Woesearchaeota archaeon]
MKLDQLLESVKILGDSTGALITAVSPELDILYANEKAKNTFEKLHEPGYVFEGKKCYEAYRLGDRICPGCPTAEIAAGEISTESVETHNKLIDRQFIVTSKPIYENGKLAAVLEIAQDITGITKYRKAVIHAEKLNALNIFAARIAHDLRNLLSTIIEPARLAKKAIQTGNYESAKDCLDIVENGAGRAAGLVNDLLPKAKSEKYTRGPVDISSILESAVKLFQPEYDFHKIRLESEIKPVPIIDGYQSGIESVFRNMLTNALQAYDKSRVVGNRKVVARAYHKEGYIYVEFQDNGCGIKRENLPKIFEFGFTTKENGCGIGLASDKAIIEESHFGKIIAESEGEGKGAKFTIKLPDAQTLKKLRRNRL